MFWFYKDELFDNLRRLNMSWLLKLYCKKKASMCNSTGTTSHPIFSFSFYNNVQKSVATYYLF